MPRNLTGATGLTRLTCSHRRLQIWAFFLAALVAGCASPGEPLPRKVPVPAAVTDLAAEQIAGGVVLTFTLPKETVDHRVLLKTPAIEIYRDFLATPPEGAASPAAPANPTLLVTIPSSLADQYATQGKIRFVDSLKPEDFSLHSAGEVIYLVRTRESEKKSSPDSNPAALRVFPPAEPIADAKAELTHSAIVLTWTPPSETLAGTAPAIVGYRIHRAEAAPEAQAAPGEPPKLHTPLASIGEASSPPFRDAQFAFGKTYVYSVRSVTRYGTETLESADSNLVTVAARDIFPPAPPQGLEVVNVPAVEETPAHLDLSWSISPEPDIAGYNIYRSEREGARGEKLNPELLPTPAFRDMSAVLGHRYFYTVTAVDRSGNESQPSAAASGVIPAAGSQAP